MNTPTKITNLQLPGDTYQEIFWFDVAVNDMFAVEIHERISHLVNVSGASFLGKAPMFAELFVKLSLASEFKHKKYTFLVMEISIETENIWMAEVLLDFNFASDLLLDFGLNDLRFVESFQGKNVMRLALGAYHIDAAKFAFTEWSAHVEAM